MCQIWCKSVHGWRSSLIGRQCVRDSAVVGKKGKGRILIERYLHTVTSRTLQFRKWQLIGMNQWCCSANCGHPLHALTYNWTRAMQLANTPPLQSTTPGLHPVSFHQMAPPVQGNTHPITAYYSVYRPRKDERLSRPGWLVTYRNKVPSRTRTRHPSKY